MADKKLISVIVPVYRVEKYLDRCIKSILSQTYRNLEIILVDDGSPDDCGKICDRYAGLDHRITVIHQMNSGSSGARNTGLGIAHGEYVCFVDSDDEIDPQMIETLYRAISCRNDDLALCGHQQVKGNTAPQAFQPDSAPMRYMTSDELWQEVFSRMNNAVWNKLYRRDLIGNLRFPAGVIHGEDLIFNLKYLIGCESAVLIDAPLYHYYTRPGSVTNSVFNENRFDEVITKDMAMDIIRKYHPALSEEALAYCFRARMNVIRAIYRSGREEEYPIEIQEYKSYARKYYPQAAHLLSCKERVEYHLLQSAEPAYRMITKSQALGSIKREKEKI